MYCTCTYTYTHACSAAQQDCLLQQFAVPTNPVNCSLKWTVSHPLLWLFHACMPSIHCLHFRITKSDLSLLSNWPYQALCSPVVEWQRESSYKASCAFCTRRNAFSVSSRHHLCELTIASFYRIHLSSVIWSYKSQKTHNTHFCQMSCCDCIGHW